MKKVFVLAGISAVSGLLVAMAAAGCSSSTVVVDDTDAADAAKDTSPKDVFVPDDDASDSASLCPTTDVITAAELEMGITWAPPAAPSESCTQADVDLLRSNLATATTYTAVQAGLSASCLACVFTSAPTATAWGPFVSDGTAGEYFDNTAGSCFAYLSGSNTCGQKRFDFDACANAACSDDSCSTTETKFEQCEQSAQSGACKQITTDYAAACPGETTYIGTETAPGPCGTLLQTVKTLCAGGPDASIDASN